MLLLVVILLLILILMLLLLLLLLILLTTIAALWRWSSVALWFLSWSIRGLCLCFANRPCCDTDCYYHGKHPKTSPSGHDTPEPLL
jgi:hypothetical protein